MRCLGDYGNTDPAILNVVPLLFRGRRTQPVILSLPDRRKISLPSFKVFAVLRERWLVSHQE